MKKGLLIVISGPSGVGKGTVIKELMKNQDLNLIYSISMTTRKARNGEQNGVNYFFVDEKEFLEKIKEDNFLEYANFVGNYYGTPKDFVERKREEGFNVLLEIEVEGAKQVLSKCKDALSIFLIPPSIEELEKRIRNRKTESDEVIFKRLEKANREISETNLYNYVVCNQSIEKATEEIGEIIKNKILNKSS